MVYSENSEQRDKREAELTFSTSMENPDLKDGPIIWSGLKKYNWLAISIAISLLCMIWLIEHKLNLGINLSAIPYIVATIGTVLVAISALVFLVESIVNMLSENFSIFLLKLLIVALPFFLIWGPAPYGVIFTIVSTKADSNPVCIGSSNVTSSGTTSSSGIC